MNITIRKYCLLGVMLIDQVTNDVTHEFSFVFFFFDLKVRVVSLPEPAFFMFSSYIFYSGSFLIRSLLKFKQWELLSTKETYPSFHPWLWHDGPCDSESDLAFVYIRHSIYKQRFSPSNRAQFSLQIWICKP